MCSGGDADGGGVSGGDAGGDGSSGAEQGMGSASAVDFHGAGGVFLPALV